ncbi:hypothetical protein [Candidatus Carsonella ruddii]|uniref:4Fe-4S ferredoxin-type domain-containing protein n=1 Tax=Candidatus Carsonella ruddii CE isolate Thao2000 TaxID=1202536 RepID=J7GSX2_CARRU|nr:hypothetical protein [Candidatus Carsonella ruddii]AFP83589.1 hypothetical protein A33U_0133 [Candidatus Carsonella ruddii CE isolate Thao2000]
MKIINFILYKKNNNKNKKHCINCKICIFFCPKNKILYNKKKIKIKYCFLCKFCKFYCLKKSIK